ncbi:lipopolysaccharide assembly protein LapB [Pseudanabaena sp. 'Roaring Creek']|uniref:tetratricopeptide repeat protein n=1 Tax=Pseudanabaena sp. 'Roaring Creek' TaxID=1681830 RepID=UPI0018D10A59|nr:tetratricopeptide repeat protein [Pseudanabaena sp. 'Roaring Creek']
MHPSIYPDWVDGNSSDRPQLSTNSQNISTPESIPELTLEFIGRDRDLTNLANLSRQAKIVLIKAGAGIGKSTLAREFLQTYFKKVIRIEMGLESGNVTPAEEKVSQILRKDFDEEPSRDFGINLDILREKLGDRANPIGVLIDNLEPALDENYRFREKLRGYDTLLAVLGDRDVFSFTLITSRRSLITTRARVHEYSLEGLDITAWQQYFHDCESGVDSETLLQMRDAYNGNAKVMDILHGAIKNRFDGNIGAYWSRYKDALLADSELETLISMEMDWLRDNKLDAYNLLCRMGCYRYQDVKTVPFEGLICLLWDVSESRKACVVHYLSKSSLIEVKVEYYLHPAVRESAKSCLLNNKIDWELANRKAADFWTGKVHEIETIVDALIAFEAYHHYTAIKDFSHAGNTLVKIRKNKWDNGEKLCKSFYRLGLLQQMIHAIDSIKEFIKSSYTLSHMYNTLGDLYLLTGQINIAIDYHKKSGLFAEKVLQEDNNTLEIQFWAKRLIRRSLFNQGRCYIEIMEFKRAFDLLNNLCKQVSKIYKFGDLYANGEYENDTINNTLSVLALASSKIGLQRRAYCLAELGYRKILTPSSDSMSQGYNPLFFGMTYQILGEFTKAEVMFNHAIKYAKESNYRQVEGKAINGLAEIYRRNGEIKKAVDNHLLSIEILEKIGAICDLAEAYFQLGLTYQAMGEHDQVEEYKAKALKLFAQMEAPKQIERVNKAFGGNIQ